MLAQLKRFGQDESGLTLIESTFIMTILLLVMVNGVELDRYARFARHLEAAAESLAVITGSRTQALRDQDWSDDASALRWFFSEAASLSGAQWREALAVQATFVRFEGSDPACTADCAASSARVIWTWSGGTAGSRAMLLQKGLLRLCGSLIPGSNVPAAQTLPASLFRVGPLLVVTLAYDYDSFFPASVVGHRSLVREAYMAPAAGDLPVDPFGAANEVVPCP
jgi:Flp pilus assembly pilin Flp